MSTGMTTWLLALDGSPDAERAARYVARVAKKQGVDEIHLLNVQPPHQPRTRSLPGSGARRQADETATRIMAPVRRILEAAGLATRPHVALGEDPAFAIVAAAQRLHAGEIVMGTRGTSAIGNLVLGSVAYKVLQLARQPLTLLPRPRRGRKLRLPSARGAPRVLLAVDGSSPALRAVAYVCSLREAGATVHVRLVNVQPQIASASVLHAVSQAHIDAYYRGQGETALRGAKRLLDGAGIKFRHHVVAGAYPESVVALAREHRCTRIVMGTRGLGSVKGLVLGSMTYDVLYLAETAVTVVK